MTSVRFVGAGPGSSRWLTLAARDAIAAADVVLVDALVAPSVLSFIQWGTEVIDVGKRGGQPSMPQAEICELLVEFARAERNVVRLKGGDPCTFGRLNEEIAAVRSAGFDYEILPGISAASAVAARAGIPLTDRDLSASVTMLTGHRRAAGPRPTMDWQAASRSGTGVVYMGVLDVRHNAQRLIDEGVDPTTPALVAQSVATPGEIVVTSTLAEIADVVEQAGIRPPAVWLYGGVAAGATGGPLLCKGYVGLLRPYGRGERWMSTLSAHGWEPCHFPLQMIEFDAAPVDAMQRWASSGVPDWLMFTSPTAVEQAWKSLARERWDVRQLAGCNLAAVGSATADALRRCGLSADYIGDHPNGAAAMVEAWDIPPGRIALLQAADADTDTETALLRLGWVVEQVPTHTKQAANKLPGALKFALERDRLDALIWSSASQVELVSSWRSDLLAVAPLNVAIGEKTAAALRETQAQQVLVPSQPSIAAICELLEVGLV